MLILESILLCSRSFMEFIATMKAVKGLILGMVTSRLIKISWPHSLSIYNLAQNY